MARSLIGLSLAMLTLGCGGKSGHRSSPDDGGDGPMLGCADSEVLALYDQCLAADDQRACEAAGGSWQLVGLASEEECQCPTGQSDCRCDSSDDCLSACIADLPGGDGSCGELDHGYCSSVSITVGCYCWFREDGQDALPICAD